MVRTSETFAQRLRRMISDKGISQTDLATRVDIDRTDLNRLVNGKRSPKPREAAWLIEALGIEPKVFLSGLDVAGDPAFHDEVEQHRVLARRVLEAERERDEAKAARNSIEASFRAEEMAWRDERKQLQAALADFRRDCADRVKQRDDALAKRENELLEELSSARDKIAAGARQLRAVTQVSDDRLRQIGELQTRLGSAESRVTTAGLFGGLVGAVLGSAVTGRKDDGDDDDIDKNDQRRK